MTSAPNKGPKDPARFSDWDESTVRVVRKVTTEKFDPSQPRDPAGSDTGGQWTGGAGGGAWGAHGTVSSGKAVHTLEKHRREEWARMAKFRDSDPETAEFLEKYPTQEAFEEAQRKALADMTNQSVPAMQVPLPTLTGKINADGEFKSTFETGKTGSAMGSNEEYRGMRAEYEADLFSVGAGAAPGERPKYGFLMGKDAEAHLRAGVPDQYGDATVVFKDSVRGRTTFTENDSLDSRGYRLPSPLGKPSHLSAYPGTDLGSHMRALKPRGPASGHGFSAYYDEAQYHGKLSVSDIQHVYLRAEPNKTQRPRLEKMAARHGFTWSVVSVPKDEDDD